MLKKILITLVVVVAGLAVVIALQPSAFTISRSATIAAAPVDVFPQVNDFHNWDAWSPWAKLDPKAKINGAGFTFPERLGGLGGVGPTQRIDSVT